MEKIKLLVLFGGQSTEHEISCLSCYSVLRNVDAERFSVTVCGISKKGDWCPIPGDYPREKIKDGSWTELVTEGAGIAPAVAFIQDCDAVFPVMHGIMAEDGTMQGLIKLLGKPCVGPGVLASALCMDKVYTKIVLDDAGIPQAKSVTVTRQMLEDFPLVRGLVRENLGYPCFVKPSNSGSSVGAAKVSRESELETAVREAAKYDSKILVEEYVAAKEVECAVLGNREPYASTPGEIVSTAEFYDYDDKYIKGTSSTRIPADIPEEARERIRTLAVRAYKAVGCRGLSRVDFFYEKGTGRILLNEINTIPGFTEISMYGKMMAYDGVDFGTLITKLVLLAMDAYNEEKIEL